jgi:hypothetical protein
MQPSGKPWTDPFELGERPFFCRKMGCFFRPSNAARAARLNANLRCSLAVSASRMSNSAMAALSSKLLFRVASVALTFRNLGFRFSPLVGRE